MNRTNLLITAAVAVSLALATTWGARTRTPKPTPTHTMIPRPAMPRVIAPPRSGEPGAINLRAPQGLRYSSAVVSSP